ncbi:hypothetical protein GIV19_18265 [Pseudomonas syringae]|uniref:hypothetical protein n=1 Tax=Pseudomonas syringae TaxID=317 RepID=UPI001F34A452|nr:hypothetical protein [Pseudomonas syringae]MCF5709216.1 hypothetical protein [Pseudomonas syringae]
MIPVLFLLMALSAIFYIGLVIFRVVTADARGGISNVLTPGTLFKMSLALLGLCATSGLMFLGGTASGISGSGGTTGSHQIMDYAANVSEFCLYASLALAVAALISYAHKKNIL